MFQFDEPFYKKYILGVFKRIYLTLPSDIQVKMLIKIDIEFRFQSLDDIAAVQKH